MTHEEMENTIEFILKQQAQFSANIQKLEEAQTRAEARMGRLESAFVNLFNIVTETATAQKQTEARLIELAEAQKRTETAVAETNERLNNFILIVERYISESQNGKSRS